MTSEAFISALRSITGTEAGEKFVGIIFYNAIL